MYFIAIGGRILNAASSKLFKLISKGATDIFVSKRILGGKGPLIDITGIKLSLKFYLVY